VARQESPRKWPPGFVIGHGHQWSLWCLEPLAGHARIGDRRITRAMIQGSAQFSLRVWAGSARGPGFRARSRLSPRPANDACPQGNGVMRKSDHDCRSISVRVSKWAVLTYLVLYGVVVQSNYCRKCQRQG
jgi:hypothetical protein